MHECAASNGRREPADDLNQVAGRVGVSQMHVSRLINQSLARLHDIMHED